LQNLVPVEPAGQVLSFIASVVHFWEHTE